MIKQTFKLDIFCKIMTKLGLMVAKDISKFLIPVVILKNTIQKIGNAQIISRHLKPKAFAQRLVLAYMRCYRPVGSSKTTCEE